jgi:hypothetical protein
MLCFNQEMARKLNWDRVRQEAKRLQDRQTFDPKLEKRQAQLERDANRLLGKRKKKHKKRKNRKRGCRTF